MSTPVFAEFMGALIRWALTLITGYLSAKHVITADQADRLATELVKHALLLAPAAVALAWSVVQKYRSRLKFLAAQELPAGASDREVRDHMKLFTVSDTLRSQ
jgi:uncharacterized membrane protein YqjE